MGSQTADKQVVTTRSPSGYLYENGAQEAGKLPVTPQEEAVKKAMLAGLAGLAAVSAVGLAAPATASIKGGCYVDDYRRCLYMTPDQMTYGDSVDMAVYGTTPDQHFAYFVTHSSAAPFLRIIDFDLVKAQGLRVCQLGANGMSSYEAVKDLQRNGGYNFDQANAIGSAAETIYCPWVHPVSPSS
ncbi:MAG: DUF732 domain-containing protein [Akkermansiaceae bacterium]|nr:DUF732 domain-containing protein [Akkermansiaceae bacterium]